MKNARARRAKVLFFFRVKHANLWHSCHRRGYLNCVYYFYMIKQNVYIHLIEGDDWCQPSNNEMWFFDAVYEKSVRVKVEILFASFNTFTTPDRICQNWENANSKQFHRGLSLKVASRNIVHLKKSFYVVSTSASIFFNVYVKLIRSLLIQRTPAGSSFRLFG